MDHLAEGVSDDLVILQNGEVVLVDQKFHTGCTVKIRKQMR